jgi:hypothetical protein
MDRLLSSGSNETTVHRNGWVAKTADTHVYMESLEEPQDEDYKPKTMWRVRMASPSMGIYSIRVLACGR